MRSPYGLELTGSCETCPLKSNGFFCNMSEVTLKALDSIRFMSGYPKGAVLFVEQEAPRGVFVLCKGRVKLSMTSAEGKTVILRIVRPGEVLGLHAVVSGELYQASAETLEPCQVNFVRREDFLHFLSQHAEASLRAAQHLSGSYHAACEQIRSLGLTHSASEKLARFLLESTVTGQQTNQGIRVRLTMTHEEIGQVIGTSRETVTRTFGELKNRHLVAVNGSVLLIPSKTALESFAGA
ncbi:MAG TPA: Crp/Fnr family transcriptional regulator [Terriglobia bacterium]|nr:Crp/Fnr family transcriptional regulator [Terriglobia bacterium]